MSEFIYDGYAVYQGMTGRAKLRTRPDNVSDVLDSLHRLEKAARQQAVPSVCPRCLGASPEKVYGASAAFPPYEICSNLEHVPVTYAANTAPQAEPECKCSMRIKMTGDGCEACNPELAAQILADNEADALEETEQAVEPWIIRVYNLGYHNGHHHTVEGTYTDVHRSDMDSYHADVVQEILEDMGDLKAAPPAPEVSGLVEALEMGERLISGEAVGAEWKNGCREFIKAARAARAAHQQEGK